MEVYNFKKFGTNANPMTVYRWKKIMHTCFKLVAFYTTQFNYYSPKKYKKQHVQGAKTVLLLLE